MFISVAKLDQTKDDTIIIDTRSSKEYADGHIPHSVNLDLFSLHWFDSSKQGIEMFDIQMRKIFSFVGITDKQVVFYDSISGMLSARGVWMLMHFSHPHVYMLDGGITKWKTDGFPLEITFNAFTPSLFNGKINSDVITGYQYIHENIDDLIIIDARSKEEFDGSMIRAARKGHILNAINIDWNQNLNKDGTIKDNDNLSKLYDIPKNAQIVTYCQGAYRAANSFLALKKLGYENVKVYLGSWGEWGNKLDLPISD